MFSNELGHTKAAKFILAKDLSHFLVGIEKSTIFGIF